MLSKYVFRDVKYIYSKIKEKLRTLLYSSTKSFKYIYIRLGHVTLHVTAFMKNEPNTKVTLTLEYT